MTQADALDILKTGANVFLTGEPGSGKTHTLNAYIKWLTERGIEPAVTASTGIAATHIGGMTIHSWSGIGILDELSAQDLDRILSKEHVVKRIQKTHVLILDEISMLSGGTLSMLDEIMRTARHDSRAFGGVQIIFCGDFFQLPPITRGGRTTEFAFSSGAWRSAMPLTCYLSEQHRQEDDVFLEILSAIRNGSFDHSHASKLLARSHDTEDLLGDIPRLFTHNTDVDSINEKHLATLTTTPHHYVMEETGPTALTEGLKRGCLSPTKLTLKKGAVVMCTKNNAAGGYVNGTLGTVIDFVRSSGEPIIETHDGREIVITPNDWVIEENGKIRAKISQIPLRLAWAITIHKSQGMSMDAAAIDLSKTFEYGQGYVALSRVRTLSGLTLLGWSESATRLHPEILQIDERFREESDAAVEAFSTLRDEGDLQSMHKNFIQACGGSLSVIEPGLKAKKKTTYDETHELLMSGTPLTDIATVRNLTIGTIADHAEKLISSGRLDTATLLARIPAKLVASLPDIHAVFEEIGTEKLAPVYHALNGKYTYDELKLSRIFFSVAEESEVF